VGRGVSVWLGESDEDADGDPVLDALALPLLLVDALCEVEPLDESDAECDPEVEYVGDGVGVGGGVMVWLGELEELPEPDFDSVSEVE